MFNIGPEELLLILVLALIIFGPKRLPEIGRTIGNALREFRRATEGVREEITRHLDGDAEDDGFTGVYPVTAAEPTDVTTEPAPPVPEGGFPESTGPASEARPGAASSGPAA